MSAPIDATPLALSDQELDEARRFNGVLERMLAGVAPVEVAGAVETRRRRAEGSGVFGAVRRSERPVNRFMGGVPVRTVVPVDKAPLAVYLHIHGGGWALGAVDEHDPLLEGLADFCQLAVVSVDYRLAPEHPYPAGPDDCEAVASWLVEHADAEYGTPRLLIGGESAGAHLCVLTLLRLRDRLDAAKRFVAANLVFGFYDLTLTPSARDWGERNFVLSTPTLEWFAEQFTPGMSEDERRRGDVSPLYADLAGMPGALFSVGALDPLLDDSVLMARRWASFDNDTELRVYPEAPHGFHAFPTAVGRKAIGDQLRFVTESTRPSP
ncbi:MAG: alpha/beta hydrolase [Acidimicrobiales bacterium]